MSILALGFVALAYLGINDTEHIYTTSEFKCEASIELRRKVSSFNPDKKTNDRVLEVPAEKNVVDTLKSNSSHEDILKSELEPSTSDKVATKNSVYDRSKDERMMAISNAFTDYGMIGGLAALLLLFVALRYAMTKI